MRHQPRDVRTLALLTLLSAAAAMLPAAGATSQTTEGAGPTRLHARGMLMPARVRMIVKFRPSVTA